MHFQLTVHYGSLPLTPPLPLCITSPPCPTQSLDGFGIRRKVDADEDLFFKFPVGFVIPSGSTVKIWADVNDAINNPPFQIVWQGTRSWGAGNNILTTLVSPEGEDKSVHKQTTVTETA